MEHHIVASAVLDFEYSSPGEYDFIQCRSCGLIQISPLPDSQALRLAYPSEYHAYVRYGSKMAHALKAQYWRNKAKKYSSLVQNKGAVLDIGCANGDMLEALRSIGFGRCVGLEFNSAAVQRCRARGHEVWQGELDDLTQPAESFDLIIMNNVIEHVQDPLQSAVICRKLLKPGGHFVGETPNAECWDRYLFGRYWGGYHTPRHLFLFNSTNLASLGKEAGFCHAVVENMNQPAHWALSIQNLLQASPLRLSIKNGRCAIYSMLLMGMLPINLLQFWVGKTTSVEFDFVK
jgi:2-polyprenyl-3-methyl-5-hydroxy-6-metoxy-1,4-benzoquinol methylase